jgi:hypothetical protein
MKLNDKVIFIISYENWGKMQMSKHHYAIELGRMGNKVYFINHPDNRKKLKRGQVNVEQTESQNVMVVRHRLFHPYFFKFKFRPLYYLLTSLHIRKILRSIGRKPDIVWSFDMGNTLPLKYFPDSAIKIYMPVDGPFDTEDERSAAKQSDVMISVTDRILNAYRIDRPKFQINHGVASVFLNGASKKQNSHPIKVGYSGSLIRSDLDMDCFLQLIKDHPDKIFEFWGEINYKESNLHLPQDVVHNTHVFLEALKNQHNVILHGPVSSDKLAEGIRRMDILLICYAIKNDQNHHKVLEYLGTGNVVVSSHMSSYENGQSGLIEMVNNKENNEELPELFKKVVHDIDYYNSEELRQKRIKYAREHSYLKNIERIEQFVNNTITTRK